MTNNKSQKIPFIGNGNPPLLNLTKNKSHVYSDFKSVEENNAPYINEMLQPLWKTKIIGDSVYDKYDNRYYINNGNLYKNDSLLTTVQTKKFIKEEVTDTYGNYLAFDIKNEKIAYIELTATNTIKFYETDGDIYETPRVLFVTGEIICARVRVTDNYETAVIVYVDQSNYYRYHFIIKDKVAGRTFNPVDGTLLWKCPTILTSPSAAYTVQSAQVNKCYPLINICEITINSKHYVGISLISNYCKSSIPSRNAAAYQDGIATFLCGYEEGSNIVVSKDYPDEFRPVRTSTQQSVTTDYAVYYDFSKYTSWTSVPKECLYDPNTGKYYDYEGGVKGNEITFVSQTPVYNRNVTIDEVSYEVDSYSYYTYRTGLKITYRGPTTLDSATATITYGNETETLSLDVHFNHQNDVYIEWESYDYDPNFASIQLDTCTLNITESGTTTNVQVPQDYWDGRFQTTISVTSTANVGSLTFPNVFLDSGEMISWYAFDDSTKQNYATGNIITETANITNITKILDVDYIWEYNFTAIESSKINIANLSCDSISKQFAQGFYATTVRLSDEAFTINADPSSGNVIEYVNSNCSDLRYFPGSLNDSDFAYKSRGPYSDLKDTNGYYANPIMKLCFTPAGYRTRLNNNFNLLINVNTSGSVSYMGLSYSQTDDDMGTLLTEWTSLDPDFYIVSDNNSIIYRDTFNKLYKISIVDGNDLFAIIDDRYIVINTTSYYNCYDSFLNKLTHYASDYNNRTLAGLISTTSTTTINNIAATMYVQQQRYFATGISCSITFDGNVAKDNDRIASMILPSSVTLSHINIDTDVKAYKCKSPINSNAAIKGIDVYYSDVGGAYNFYRYTIRTDGLQTSWKKFDLNNTTYVSTSDTYYSPDIFTKYIKGIGNTDFVSEGTSCYPLVYNNSTPWLLYNPYGETDNVDAFFVLQGQYYAVIQDKIYSLIYADGAISEMDAIVDIKGFRFLGNTPAIAFFWSDKLRAVFSFTGDANMSKLWNGSKFSDLYLSTNGKYFYDESTQSIFIPTDKGLLVFGTESSYLMREYKNISNIQFSDREFHIMDSGNTYNFSYYKEDDESESEHIKLETSFFGTGGTEQVSIDRWTITLYCPYEKFAGNVKLKVVSLTDCTTTSEEKTLKITKDMWDKESDFCLINYDPKLIKGQGIKLIIDSPYAIESIIPHVVNLSTTTLTSNKKMS